MPVFAKLLFEESQKQCTVTESRGTERYCVWSWQEVYYTLLQFAWLLFLILLKILSCLTSGAGKTGQPLVKE